MKSTIFPVGSLAAAFTLTLSSCGDDQSSAGASANTGPPAGENTTTYALDVCVVSGEKLGSMGNPHVITHEGTEVRFCCKQCLPEFNTAPDKYVAMLKAGKPGSLNHSEHGQ